jgi:phage terminase small subunit
MTRSKQPKPPSHLRKPTAKWWLTVCDNFELDAHHIRLLTLAAESWDQCQKAREILAKKGMTFDDRFGQPRARPEVGIERDAKIGFARLIRELSLDCDAPGESNRPPRIVGNSSLKYGS